MHTCVRMQSNLGQFFTTSPELQNACVSFCRNAAKGNVPILEPSAGRGDLLAAIREAFPSAPTHAVEIDGSLPALEPRSARDKWIEADFLTVALPRKTYKTIVGNPPYVRKGGTNLYLLFVAKCLELLAPGGELVFILPSDFFKLTGASSLLEGMAAKGAFTDVFRPCSERLFAGAAVSVMVVRYEKRRGLPAICRCHPSGTLVPYTLTKGIVSFGADKGTLLDTVATVHVGLVSGCEEVFRNDLYGNTEVLVGRDRVDRYVMPAGVSDPVVDAYLAKNKHLLLARRIRRFDESNWFEWGGLRNVRLMVESEGTDCVYISTVTRNTDPAFKGRLQRFGACLLCIVPKPGCTMDLAALVDFLNSPDFRSLHTSAGRFRIGQRVLRYTAIPSSIAHA